MASLALDDTPVTAARIDLPRVGAWVADVTLEPPEGGAPEAPSGVVTLATDDGRLRLSGWVLHAGVHAGVATARVVGGRGGLRLTASAVHYRSVPARVPLAALLAELGESLSPTSEAAVTNTLLPLWTRVAGPGGAALDALTAKLGAAWRVLADSSIWVGRDTYPSATLGDDVEAVSEAPAEDREVFAAARLPAEIAPGTSLGPRKVAFVEHTLDQGGWRSTAWYQVPGSTSDRALDALVAIARAAVRPEYLGDFPGRVTGQGADGSLDVILDDATKPPLTGVPLRVFAPGVHVLVDPGARVNVTFENADPAKPSASVFETDVSGPFPVATENSQIQEHYHDLGGGMAYAGPFPVLGFSKNVGSVALPIVPPAASAVKVAQGTGHQRVKFPA